MKCPNCGYHSDGWPCDQCGYTTAHYIDKLSDVLTGEKATLASATEDASKASAQAGIDAVAARISKIQAIQDAQMKQDVQANTGVSTSAAMAAIFTPSALVGSFKPESPVVSPVVLSVLATDPPVAVPDKPVPEV